MSVKELEKQLSDANRELSAITAQSAKDKEEIASLRSRLAIINGQRNVMANAVSGFMSNNQELIDKYWKCDEEIGKLIGREFDPNQAMDYEVLRLDRDKLTHEVERLEQLVQDFQCSSLLGDDGDGITPRHIEEHISELRRANSDANALIGAQTSENDKINGKLITQNLALELVVKQMREALELEPICTCLNKTMPHLHDGYCNLTKRKTALSSSPPSEALATIQAFQKDKELFDYAEKHPEMVLRNLNNWFANAGRGNREEWFNFRGIIEMCKGDEKSTLIGKE